MTGLQYTATQGRGPSLHHDLVERAQEVLVQAVALRVALQPHQRAEEERYQQQLPAQGQPVRDRLPTLAQAAEHAGVRVRDGAEARSGAHEHGQAACGVELAVLPQGCGVVCVTCGGRANRKLTNKCDTCHFTAR